MFQNDHEFEFGPEDESNESEELDLSKLRELSDLSDFSPDMRPEDIDSIGIFADGLGDLSEFRQLAENIDPNVPVEEYTVPNPADDFDFTKLTRRVPVQPEMSHSKSKKEKRGSGEIMSDASEKPKKEKTIEVDRRQKTGCFGGLIFFAFVVGISTLIAVVAWMAAVDVLALGKEDLTAVVEIGEGDDVKTVSEKLKEAGIIRYPLLFRLFGSIADAEEKISSGSFELNTTMDYRAIISSMGKTSDTRLTVTVTIPEGYELDRILKALSDNGVAELEALQDTAANYDFEYEFLDDLPLGVANRLEGYLFPDTYQFYVGENTVTALSKMLSNFNTKFDTGMRERASEIGYSMHEIVIIASLIEKEAAADSERAAIASVIYNRLRSPDFPYLGIDATVLYALPERKESLSEADLQIDSPYNTYVYEGLPVGPIACPGWASLNAALYPETTGYYYYALNEDGLHKFSVTLAEHNEFVERMRAAGVQGY